MSDLLELARSTRGGETSERSERSASRHILPLPSSRPARPHPARKARRKRIPRVPCATCELMCTDTYDDGSPRYDHGHDPVTGERWWGSTAEEAVPSDPVLALLTGRGRFRSREGRDRERWSFVAWLREGERYQAHEVSGVTGMRGPRRRTWETAVSASPWCRLRLEAWDERLGIAEVSPVARLSDEQIDAYVEVADIHELDLLAEAVHIFMDLLPPRPVSATSLGPMVAGSVSPPVRAASH